MSSVGEKLRAEPEEIVIRPLRGWNSLQLKEIWAYRGLLYFLVWRDVKVRYKQTALGIAWVVLQPLMTTAVFTIFFGRLANVGSDGLPYPVFSFAGLLPWTLFATGLSQSAASLVGSSNLISKVYFPRLIIPIAAVLVGIVDFAVTLVMLLGFLAYYRLWPTPAFLLLPFFAVLAAGTALGIGMWLSALNVKYRDVRYVVPFVIQLWLFVTPVIYPASLVGSKLNSIGLPAWLYGLNPMAGVVEGFRWAALGTGHVAFSVILTSICVTVVLLVTGAFYFRRTETTFADIV